MRSKSACIDAESAIGDVLCGSARHCRESSLKRFERGCIEQNELDAIERRGAAQMISRFFEHHFGASFHREARYTSAHRGKRYRLEPFFLCTQQGVARRGAQIFL